MIALHLKCITQSLNLMLNLDSSESHIMHLTRGRRRDIKQNSRKRVRSARVVVTVLAETLETCQTRCLEFLVSNPYG